MAQHHPDYTKECDNLKSTILQIDREIENFNVKRPKQKDWTLHQLYRLWTGNRKRLMEVRGEPYFGRVDFRRVGEPDPGAYYIGKVGAPGVVDWRAPIANLFYESSGGPTKYVAPEGTIHGHLSRRRQYRISQGELLELFDSLIEDSIRKSLGEGTTEWADPFLISELGRSAGDRLKDIVATIQAEQNRVIRAPYDSVVVVQGVAGSGKTTVALHRVAYLLYNNPIQIRSEKVLVIAPNRLFLQYIEGLLPDTLGVIDVEQQTFQSWALGLLGKSWKAAAYRDEGSMLSQLLQAHTVKPALSAWLNAFIEERSLPPDDLRLAPNHLIPGARIREWFFTDYCHWPIMARIERLKKRLLSERRKYIEAVKSVAMPTKARRLDEQSQDALNAYLKLLPSKDMWLEAWVSFLEDPNGAQAILGPGARKELDAAAALARKKRCSPEDLAAIAYLYTRLHGVDERERYDHIVVDEAQDLTPVHCAVLAERCARPSLTLVGDLAQAIHTESSVSSWKAIIGDSFGDANLLEFGFTKSYRSTREIVMLARDLISKSGSPLPLPEPVLRSGRQPVLRGFTDDGEMTSALVQALDDLGGRHRTIAVLTKTAERAEHLHSLLAKQGIGLCLISGPESMRSGNVLIMPVEMARGLEFDAVVVADASADFYPITEQNLRKLYVSVTRALHELQIFWVGEPSPFITTRQEG